MSGEASGGFAQGRSTSRPPLFVGNNFVHWRSLIKMFIIDQDLELWNIIETGSKVPVKDRPNGTKVVKTEAEYIQADLELVSKNYRAT